MKNPIIYFLLFVWSFQFSYAQKINILEGTQIKSKMRLIEIIGDFDDNVLVVMQQKRAYYIRTYNAKLEPRKLVEIPMTYNNKEMEFASAVKLEKRLFILSIFNNKKKHKTYLLYREYSPQTLKPIGKLTIMGEIPYKSRYDKGDFSYTFSQNKKRILLYHNLPYNKGGNQKLAFAVLDTNLKTIWKENITLSYNDKLFVVADYEVDDEGNVYVIGKKYRGKLKDVIDGKINFKYIILGYFNQGQEEREYELNAGKKFITDVRLAIDPDLNLICAGLYTDGLRSYAVSGSFMLKIDHNSGAVTTSKFHKFDIDFLTSLLSEKQKEKKKKKAAKNKKDKDGEFYNYDMRRLILRDDGGVLLIGERSYYRVYTTYNATTGSYSTTYYYFREPILVVNFNPDGSVKWERLVPKWQGQVNNSYYLSFIPAVFQDKVIFFYNDNVENSHIKNIVDYKMYKPTIKKTDFIAYSIDSQGEEERVKLFNMTKLENIVVPYLSKQLDNDDIILFLRYGKRQRLMRISFSDY